MTVTYVVAKIRVMKIQLTAQLDSSNSFRTVHLAVELAAEKETMMSKMLLTLQFDFSK